MAPPTQHLLYPILEVEYDDQHRAHILSDNDAEVSLPPLRSPLTYGVLASSSLFMLSTTVFRPLTQHYLLQL